jgi:hypothetical protein
LSGDIEAAKKEYENILEPNTGRFWWGDLTACLEGFVYFPECVTASGVKTT